MALEACRECGKEVAKSAKQCPHCGVAWPANKTQAVAQNMQKLGCALTLLITIPFLIIAFAPGC